MSRPLKISLMICGLTFALVMQTAVDASARHYPIDYVSNDLGYLASDELEGRLAGSPGCDMAADYISSIFQDLRLEPIDRNSSYFQNFEVISAASLGVDNSLQISTPDSEFIYSVGDDFLPLYFSPDGLVEGEVVFAGYGITSDKYGWDDYEGLDATGKIVMCMKDEPGRDDPQSPFEGIEPTFYSGLRWKAFNALNHGAIGLILVTGPAFLDEGEADEFIGLDLTGGLGQAGIPVIQVSQDVAATLFGPMGAPLSMYQNEMERHGMAFGSEIEGVLVNFSVELEREFASTKNVIGFLRGTDPALRDQWLIIGAHYDHIGYGGEASLYRGEPAIHNGADDNASGVAAMLELARMFTSPDSLTPRRSILFIAFSAEEMGALGSTAYIRDPIVPLEDTVAMINMDMVGRARPGDDGYLHCAIHSAGSALEWMDIIPEFSPDGTVEFMPQSDPIGGGDYVNFYLQGIPDLNFFTGIHEDYHRPTDDYDTINYEGLVSIIEGIYQIVCAVADRDERLTFQRITERSAIAPSENPSYSVYLGTIPDYTNVGDEFFIVGVNPGSPADLGGLMAGDQIIRLGDYEVTDIYNYTYALGEYDPGDNVDIVVIRDGEEVILTVTFVARGE